MTNEIKLEVLKLINELQKDKKEFIKCLKKGNNTMYLSRLQEKVNSLIIDGVSDGYQ